MDVFDAAVAELDQLLDEAELNASDDEDAKRCSYSGDTSKEEAELRNTGIITKSRAKQEESCNMTSPPDGVEMQNSAEHLRTDCNMVHKTSNLPAASSLSEERGSIGSQCMISVNEHSEFDVNINQPQTTLNEGSSDRMLTSFSPNQDISQMNSRLNEPQFRADFSQEETSDTECEFYLHKLTDTQSAPETHSSAPDEQVVPSMNETFHNNVSLTHKSESNSNPPTESLHAEIHGTDRSNSNSVDSEYDHFFPSVDPDEEFLKRFIAGEPLPPSADSVSSTEITESFCERQRSNNTIGQLGCVEPRWVADKHRIMCGNCEAKFTLINRRHHCRCCGEIFCAKCSDQKRQLSYNPDQGLQRVCKSCNDLLDLRELEKSESKTPAAPRSEVAAHGKTPKQDSGHGAPGYRPVPRDAMEYCSTVPPPINQTSANAASGSRNWVVWIPNDYKPNESSDSSGSTICGTPVSQPQETNSVDPAAIKSVLKPNLPAGCEGNAVDGRHVTFADGISPGGALAEDHPTSKYDILRKAQRAGNAGSQGSSTRRQFDPTGTSNVSAADDDEVDIVERNERRSREKSLCDCWDGRVPYPSFQIVGQHGRSSDPNDLEQHDFTSTEFFLERNLVVKVELCNLWCCGSGQCFVYVTDGLQNHCHPEVVVVLRAAGQNARVPPVFPFKLFLRLYKEALLGVVHGENDHTVLHDGEQSTGGFIFVSPTLQCEQNLPNLPLDQPYLYAVALQKWELIWAKAFPLRLLLRLGHEFKHYPCPIVSVDERSAVLVEAGNTLLSQFVDLSGGFSFNHLHPITDAFANIGQDNNTTLYIPRNRYNHVVKALTKRTSEDVLALFLSFSRDADSHLVSIEGESGYYQPQAICRNTDGVRKCTGVSFIIFNASIRRSGPNSSSEDSTDDENAITAQCTIVEDGILVQTQRSLLTDLRDALLAMKDFKLPCQSLSDFQQEKSPSQYLSVQWIADHDVVSSGYVSMVDGRDLETAVHVNVFNSCDYLVSAPSSDASCEEEAAAGAGDGSEAPLVIRWPRMFYLEDEEPFTFIDQPNYTNQLPHKLAKALCVALAPHAHVLRREGKVKLGLRVNISCDGGAEYQAGANRQPLSQPFTDSLDTHLVPIIFDEASRVRSTAPIGLELHFLILPMC